MREWLPETRRWAESTGGTYFQVPVPVLIFIAGTYCTSTMAEAVEEAIENAGEAAEAAPALQPGIHFWSADVSKNFEKQPGQDTYKCKFCWKLVAGPALTGNHSKHLLLIGATKTQYWAPRHSLYLQNIVGLRTILLRRSNIWTTSPTSPSGYRMIRVSSEEVIHPRSPIEDDSQSISRYFDF